MAAPAVVLEAAFGSNWNAPSPSWTDITADWRGPIRVSRGRSDELSTVRPSTMTVTLSNLSRDYDPENTAGPYYGDLVPMVPIRLRATQDGNTYDLFRGLILDWPNVTRNKKNQQVTLTCYDALTVLQLIKLRPVWVRLVEDLAPRAWWRLNETNGTQAADSSGNDYHGTYSGATLDSTESPYLASAQPTPRFDGVNDYVDVPDAAGLAGTGPRSLGVWFKCSSGVKGSGTWTIYSQDDTTGSGAGNGQMLVDISNAFSPPYAVSVRVAEGSTSLRAFSDVAVNDSEWHLLFYTWQSGSPGRLYLDGTQRGTHTDATVDLASRPTWIGRRNPAAPATQDYFDGWISDVVSFDAVLDAATIAELYAAGPSPWAGQDTGSRVDEILDAAGWPTGLRDIDAGETTLVAWRTPFQTALSALHDTVASEGGWLEIDGAGVLVFHNRDARTGVSVADTFGGAGHRYFDLAWTRDDINLRTVAVVADSDGNRHTAVDTTAVGQFGERTVERSTLTNTPSELVDYANWLLSAYATSLTRFPYLRLRYGKSATDAEWAALLSRELGDLIAVEHQPVGGGDPIEATGFVEEITLTVNPGRLWDMSMQLSNAASTPTAW